MKRLSLLFIALSIITVVYGQKKESRQVPTFANIAYSIPGKLLLTQGNQQKLELEGSEEALSKVKTEVKGDELVITSTEKFSWGSGDKVTIHITMKDLRSIRVSGSGNLAGQNKFATGALDLKVSGSGSLTLDFQASGDVEADVAGSGSIQIAGSAPSLESNVSGSGRVVAEMDVKETTSFSISGSGKIEASGSTKAFKASLSGSGQVRAAEMEAVKCEVRITGSGSAEVNAQKELDARISGSGSVGYKGSPAKVNSHSSGSGKVRKI